MSFKKYDGSVWQAISPKQLKGIPYSGTLPAVLTGTKAGYLHRYKIYGNTEQTGTPTPENPIYPSECGERTGNLFDKTSASESGYIDDNGSLIPSASVTTYDYIDITGNTEVSYKAFTLTSGERGTIRIAYYDENKSFLSRYVKTNMALQWTTVTLPSGCVYVRFSLDNNLSDTMLVEGSTALPYEPYGYKLPLTSGSTPVDIYLGESQTTRRIKKLVLTGEEEWTRATNGTFYGYFVTDYYNLEGRITICSHYIGDLNRASTATVNDKACCFRISDSKTIYIRDTSFNSATAFSQYLAQQYANGTPVTVWYVLATEQTGTLNEPLRKIGDYADTIDSTQTSVQIPTSANSTTISWAGSGLEPSEFDSIQEWVDIPTYKRVNGEWVADN